MNREHKESEKGFTWHSESFYGKTLPLHDAIDELNIGFYHPDGGCDGEFSIQWTELSGKLVSRLVAFNDGWNALVNMPELLEYMKSIDDKDVSISEFVDNLLKLGFKDNTSRTRKDVDVFRQETIDSVKEDLRKSSQQG